MCCRKEFLLGPTRQRFRNATGGSHVPSPWPVPKTTTSTKMWKIRKRKLGGDNGGSPQSKQVGPKPACPSFQPSNSRDKRQANVETKAGKNGWSHWYSGADPAKHTRIRLKIGLSWSSATQSSMTGNSNKCLKLHLSHNLPRHIVITNQLVIWILLFFLHMITREITRRHDRDICLCVPGVLSPLPCSIFKSLRLYYN